MDIGLIRKIMEDNPDSFGHRTLFLHYGGESLLHPRLGEAIATVAGHGVRCNLSTNGAALGKKKSLEIIESGLHEITLCMDSHHKEDYEKYRVGAKFERTRRNIIEFLEMKAKMGSRTPLTRLQIIETPESRDEFDAFVDFWRPYPVDFIHIKRFIGRAGQLDGLNEDLVMKEYVGSSRVPCKWFWEMVNVTWNGIVNICCQDYQGKLPLGDLRKNTLREIWNSPRVREIRKNHIEGNFDNGLCGSCKDYRGHNEKLLSKTAMKKILLGLDRTSMAEEVIYARDSSNRWITGIKKAVKSALD